MKELNVPQTSENTLVKVREWCSEYNFDYYKTVKTLRSNGLFLGSFDSNELMAYKHDLQIFLGTIYTKNKQKREDKSKKLKDKALERNKETRILKIFLEQGYTLKEILKPFVDSIPAASPSPSNQNVKTVSQLFDELDLD